ncbi:MAG: hypothetical protein ETSY1_44050 [Candidatus Entotheonella factor]|uniref:Uncharacterized protein n=1 Tax=Entotheonella factor TaxID=1429438 RepID=W4L3W3_ENTF1|nr:MAG: hypothetical protein ETSY1_44050 [Candidatus Entotheonella factor]
MATYRFSEADKERTLGKLREVNERLAEAKQLKDNGDTEGALGDSYAFNFRF